MSSVVALPRTTSNLARTVGPPQSLAPYAQKQSDIILQTRDEATATEVCGAPEPQRPVPFLLIMLMVSAAALVVLPIFGDCSLTMHRLMLYCGVGLTVPLIVFSVISACGGRGWLLSRFFEGDYSEAATTRPLGCLWYPEKRQALEYTTGDVAGRKIETYASWETTAIVEYVENASGGNRGGGSVEHDDQDLYIGCKCKVQGLQKSPEINGKQGVCRNWLGEQKRWRFELEGGSTKDIKPENLHSLEGRTSCFKVSIPEAFGKDVKVTVDGNGALRGDALSFDAEFDGSAIVAKSGSREGQTWRKAGYWRLDVVTKILLGMAMVGLEAMFVASVLPPGVQSEGSARLPLNAVFLVDGSGSISPQQWAAAKRANKKFINDFTSVYSADHGKLNFGFVQFSTDTRVEHGITHDLTSVNSMLDGMQQLQGYTNMNKALQECQRLLDGYTAAGSKTFDVCVLITDGEDTSHKTELELQRSVRKGTAIFGIFVGGDNGGAEKLQHLVDCGQAAGKGRKTCDFFASATDFDGLAAKTREIAKDVTKGSDLVLCAERSALLETPFLVSLVTPAVLWYLSCCTITIAKRRINAYSKIESSQLPMLHDRV